MGERDLPEVGDGRDDLVPLEVHRPSLPAVNLLNLQNLVRGLVAQLWGWATGRCCMQVLHAWGAIIDACPN